MTLTIIGDGSNRPLMPPTTAPGNLAEAGLEENMNFILTCPLLNHLSFYKQSFLLYTCAIGGGK